MNVGSSQITGSANIDPTNANANLDYKVVIINANSTVTVTQKALTITPTGSQTYGGSNVGVSYSYVGFINGDTSSGVTGLSYTTTCNPVVESWHLHDHGGQRQRWQLDHRRRHRRLHRQQG